MQRGWAEVITRANQLAQRDATLMTQRTVLVTAMDVPVEFQAFFLEGNIGVLFLVTKFVLMRSV